MAIDDVRLSQLASFDLPLLRLEKKFGERPAQQLRAILVTEHAHEGGVDILQLTLGVGLINAFLQGLEQVLETGLALAFGGDVARKDAKALLGALTNQRMGGALKVSRGRFMFEANAQNAGAISPFQQGRQFELQ